MGNPRLNFFLIVFMFSLLLMTILAVSETVVEVDYLKDSIRYRQYPYRIEEELDYLAKPLNG